MIQLKLLYINDDTEQCKPSNIGAGYIPNITVNKTSVNNIKNSRLLISLTLVSNNLVNDPPKAILLNIYMVQAAENTIEELAKTPSNGNLSNTPYKDMNSPTKFKVRGTPQLPKDRIKNKIENRGII